MACIQKGQERQEVVHWGAQESWSAADGHHNQQIATDSCNVDTQKYNKNDFLGIWVLGKSEKNKLSYKALVLHCVPRNTQATTLSVPT